MAEHSKSETIIRRIAVGGIIALVIVLTLSLGVFGVKLLAAAAALPKPKVEEAATVAQTASPAPSPGSEAGAAGSASEGSAQEAPSAAAEAGAGSAETEQEIVAASGAPMTADQLQKLLDTGKNVYAQCAACHGPAGKSLIPTMAPNLVGSSLVTGPAKPLVALVLQGIQPTGRYQGVMVSWKPMLSDEQIAGVLTYIRSNFENSAPPVTTEMVARARDEFASQTTPLQRSELEEMSGNLSGE